MDINDRFRGDTEDLVVFLYEVGEDGIEYPIELLTTASTVTFSYRRGGTTKSINGIDLTDLGEVHFPFTDDTVNAVKYEYDIQVINGSTGKKRTYIKAFMTIKDDVTK